MPSATPGGTAGHYRDNRVHYVFSHIGEFVAAGGLGITFGVGAGNQTYITTDGDQFKNAVTGLLRRARRAAVAASRVTPNRSARRARAGPRASRRDPTPR